MNNDENKLQEIAELLSLGTTFPTMILSIAVILIWLPSAIPAIRSKRPKAQDWFIIGVVSGFIGSTLDNLYWFFPWSASFLDHPSFLSMVKVGIFSNVVFRQGLGIVAAYCHLQAAHLSSGISKFNGLNKLLVASNLIGVAYCAFLVLTKAF